MIFAAACSKDKGSNNNGYYNGYNNQYVMQNGVCLTRTYPQQQVPIQNCQQQGGGMYQTNQYGQCVNIQNGQPAPSPQYCQQQGGGSYNCPMTAQMGYGCYGPFQVIEQGPQFGQQGCCMGSNCSGHWMLSLTTRQTQYCQ
jgi:hypothetical protein